MRDRGADIESAIREDVDRALQLGISGSPAFVLYDRDTDEAGKLVGAQPYERFDEAISAVRQG